MLSSARLPFFPLLLVALLSLLLAGSTSAAPLHHLPRALEASSHSSVARSGSIRHASLAGKRRQRRDNPKLGLISSSSEATKDDSGVDVTKTTTKTQTALGVLTQVCFVPISSGETTKGQVCKLSLESNGTGQGGVTSVVTVTDATVTVTSTPAAAATTSTTSDAATTTSATVETTSFAAAPAASTSATPSAPTTLSVAASTTAPESAPSTVATSAPPTAATTPAPAALSSSAAAQASSASASSASEAVAAAASAAPFVLPGTQLQVLPIGLGVFAGVSVIALIVVALVTYERRKYRANFRARRAQEIRA